VPLEQEVKLACDSVEAARRAVLNAGGRLAVPRRLLDDRLFDAFGSPLRLAHSSLRVRGDGDHGFITFKGPIHPGPVKIREEIETRVASPAVARSIVEALGFHQWFRAEKYREEYELASAHIAIDETPIGTFIEIEGTPDVIEDITKRLGFTAADYQLESYQRLYSEWCQDHGRAPGDMTF